MPNNSQHSESSDDWISPTQEKATQDYSVIEYAPKTRAWGRLISASKEVGHIDLVNDEILIGRRKDCLVTFDDLRISGKHCRIFRSFSESQTDSPNAFDIYIEDLSSNGTFLNGKKLGKGNRGLVKTGDEISLVAKRNANDCVGVYMYQDLRQGTEIEQDSIIFEKYDIQQTLGTGNFSEVKLAVDRKNGVKRAVKIINKRKYWNTNTLDQVEREINILKSIQHKNIISIVEICSSEKYLYIVLELATGGELFERIVSKGSHSEEETRFIFKQILEGVDYLHKNGIAHRDLKPENILLESPKSLNIKITDFGLARIVGEREMMTTLCGTPQYVAPEIIIASSRRNQNSDNKTGYGIQVDSWSLGAILYVLLSGKPPFDDEDGNGVSLFEQIEGGMYKFPAEDWGHVSDQAKQLVSALLTVDPIERMSVSAALEHPWITHSGNKLRQQSVLNTVKSNLQKHKDQIHSSTSSPIKMPSIVSEADTDDDQMDLTRGKRKREQDQHEQKTAKKSLFT
eukprot:TRINITY_DN4871_c0_g1_i1.p1 TRINITY_DN4871_c0_g1~~TRINITY_DN4871_c0_g1_i1.p1  ORF type:complete len:513 (-),score=103.21 TRINITY_DN4871_c0_g1_i1:1072-2610(-)